MEDMYNGLRAKKRKEWCTHEKETETEDCIW